MPLRAAAPVPLQTRRRHPIPTAPTCRSTRRIATMPGSCAPWRSAEHTSELQSLMRISYAVFSLHKKNKQAPTSDTTLTSHNKQILDPHQPYHIDNMTITYHRNVTLHTPPT